MLPDGKEPLQGDAHDEVGLWAEEDVLERVPDVGEEKDVGLVLQVKVKAEAVDYEDDNKEEVDDGKSEDALVEVRLHLWPQEDGDGT